MKKSNIFYSFFNYYKSSNESLKLPYMKRFVKFRPNKLRKIFLSLSLLRISSNEFVTIFSFSSKLLCEEMFEFSDILDWRILLI